MRLSLVIPVWNDPEGLTRLLTQAREMTCLAEIIVSDDASEPPCGPGMPGLSPEVAADPRLVWLRSDRQRGAGHARNMALEQATGSHVLFFDSDDLFLPDLGLLIADLAAMKDHFDFCLFCHVDSRVRATGGYGPLPGDERYWAASGAEETPALLQPGAASQLCRIAAYPWNKIYRIGFLRETGIRCTEIPVHNDIELHWMSFLKAQRILVSRRICCEHFVIDRGDRLTNRSGRERFEVFRALQPVLAELLCAPELLAFAEPFVEFQTRLFGWITETLAPELRPEFADLVQDFLLHKMPEPLFALLALRAPGLSARVLRQAAGRRPQ
ncbi:Glycosyl transferase family 2 [Gemmobacter aquatilis]|uniref:Glycosyl transferase family 2 n=1 Tax=Gemmobacter aquatilis TaxID=933059 RepID=A0A1H8N3B2_9RHOB|nr:glycosyltransferase family 2 protein [Gemmobacter aquatilis]SEO24097.1 Glycosyl transferase family 2 [Gemmobacter aquatilis]